MFWNNDFISPSPSSIDALLQASAVKLSDILYEEDLLQELKTSNVSLANFLSRSEVVGELVDNIANISEHDCSNKQLYSRIHAAYISCEILISGASGIFAAFINETKFLDKVFGCLIYEPENPSSNHPPSSSIDTVTTNTNTSTQQSETEPSENSTQQLAGSSTSNDDKKEPRDKVDGVQQDVEEKEESSDKPKENIDEEKKTEDEVKKTIDEVEEKQTELDNQKETTQSTPDNHETTDEAKPNPLHVIMTKVVPQKAALVSKLISYVHSTSPANVVYYIRQNLETFEKLINLLVNNIDVSGALEILSTLIKHTSPVGVRDTFSEILLDLNFIFKLIDAMTLSNSEDKQRNACQLLCDIIVIGRQEAFEQHPSVEEDILPHDSLIKNLESSEAIKLLLTRMFEGKVRNTTAIICGMKVLQTLMERKSPPDPRAHTLEPDAQQEIEKRLIYIHELLLNPPKQDPIKTTFGVIQKPLGYMRLEAVNLIRVLISTSLPIIIRKLLELGTIKVIFDLFIEYPWNNLLHTQVEQIISKVIDNSRQLDYCPVVEALFNSQFCRELFLAEREVILNLNNTVIQSSTEEQEPALEQDTQKSEFNSNIDIDKCMRQVNHLNINAENDEPNQNGTEKIIVKQENEDSRHELEEDYNLMIKGEKFYKDVNSTFGIEFLRKMAKRSAPLYAKHIIMENPSRALLIQLLEECDLIGRLLMPTLNGTNGLHNNHSPESDNNNHIDSEKENAFNSDEKLALIRRRQRQETGEHANFGHIIQIINAISINRDIGCVNQHLSIMADTRPELFERWNNFVNQDVLSFKSCILFYDSSTESIGYRLIEKPKMNKNLARMPKNIDSITINQMNNEKLKGSNDYYSGVERILNDFREDHILPEINKNVLPHSYSASILPEDLKRY